MIFNMQKKRKLSANKKLLMIDRKKKKQKTEHFQVGSSDKATVQNVDNGVDGILVRESKRKLSSIIRKVIKCRKKLSIIRKVISCRKKRKMEKSNEMNDAHIDLHFLDNTVIRATSLGQRRNETDHLPNNRQLLSTLDHLPNNRRKFPLRLPN
nr:hypothetical protein [Tanacetum cinerariifolium]